MVAHIVPWVYVVACRKLIRTAPRPSSRQWEPLLSPSPDRPAYPPPSRERASGSQYPAYVPTHSMTPNKRTKAILGLLDPIRHLLPRFS